MRLVMIGDVIGADSFRLIGVEGIVAEAPEEALEIVTRLLRENAAVLIAQSLAAPIRRDIDRLLLEYKDSICLEIPDLHGEPSQVQNTQKLIEQAIGMKL